jgi:RNA polymerase primary sigma factor
MEQNNNPLIEKLLEFGKSKSIITWENVTDILGQDFIHTPEMENVLRLLEENKIQLIETDVIGIDEPTDDGDEDDIMLDQDDDDLVQDDTVSEIEKAEKAATKNKLVNKKCGYLQYPHFHFLFL